MYSLFSAYFLRDVMTNAYNHARVRAARMGDKELIGLGESVIEFLAMAPNYFLAGAFMFVPFYFWVLVGRLLIMLVFTATRIRETDGKPRLAGWINRRIRFHPFFTVWQVYSWMLLVFFPVLYTSHRNGPDGLEDANRVYYALNWVLWFLVLYLALPVSQTRLSEHTYGEGSGQKRGSGRPERPYASAAKPSYQ